MSNVIKRLLINTRINDLTELLLKAKKTDDIIKYKNEIQAAKHELELIDKGVSINVSSSVPSVYEYEFNLNEELKETANFGQYNARRMQVNIYSLGVKIAGLTGVPKLAAISEYRELCTEYNNIHGGGTKIYDESFSDFSAF